MRRGAKVAGAVFLLAWLPLSVWRGIEYGRELRFGAEGRREWGPLGDGIVNVAAVMLAPAAFAALIAFVLWNWREERRRRG